MTKKSINKIRYKIYKIYQDIIYRVYLKCKMENPLQSKTARILYYNSYSIECWGYYNQGPTLMINTMYTILSLVSKLFIICDVNMSITTFICCINNQSTNQPNNQSITFYYSYSAKSQPNWPQDTLHIEQV